MASGPGTAHIVPLTGCLTRENGQHDVHDGDGKHEPEVRWVVLPHHVVRGNGKQQCEADEGHRDQHT